MVVLLHGAVGGFDELAIAVVAFAVLWIAVKLAGRKSANDEDDEDDKDHHDEQAAPKVNGVKAEEERVKHS
jgi:flagellar biosynthesis/type III secretory pathway M-ring protein FliF/YscJ